jgi:hypothetical protein
MLAESTSNVSQVRIRVSGESTSPTPFPACMSRLRLFKVSLLNHPRLVEIEKSAYAPPQRQYIGHMAHIVVFVTTKTTFCCY